MSSRHWKRYLLQLIGHVVDIETENKVFKSVLIIDIDIGDEILLFYQRDRGEGVRGFIKGHKLYCEETDNKEPEELQR
jgi:hypothetical protein